MPRLVGLTTSNRRRVALRWCMLAARRVLDCHVIVTSEALPLPAHERVLPILSVAPPTPTFCKTSWLLHGLAEMHAMLEPDDIIIQLDADVLLGPIDAEVLRSTPDTHITALFGHPDLTGLTAGQAKWFAPQYWHIYDGWGYEDLHHKCAALAGGAKLGLFPSQDTLILCHPASHRDPGTRGSHIMAAARNREIFVDHMRQLIGPNFAETQPYADLLTVVNSKER